MNAAYATAPHHHHRNSNIYGFFYLWFYFVSVCPSVPCDDKSNASVRLCARSQMHNKYNVITWCDGFAVCNQRNLNPFKSSSSNKRYDKHTNKWTKYESIGWYELWSSYCMMFLNSSIWLHATNCQCGIMCAMDDVNLIYFIDIIRLSCVCIHSIRGKWTNWSVLCALAPKSKSDFDQCHAMPNWWPKKWKG